MTSNSGKKHFVMNAEQNNLWMAKMREFATAQKTRAEFVATVNVLIPGLETDENSVSARLSGLRKSMLTAGIEAIDGANLTGERRKVACQRLDAKISEKYPEFKRGRGVSGGGANKHAEDLADLLDGLDEVADEGANGESTDTTQA